MASIKWNLTHSVHRFEVNGLSTEECVGFLANFPSEERAQWFAWRAGMDQWAKCVECVELTVSNLTEAWLFQSHIEAEPPKEAPREEAPREEEKPVAHAKVTNIEEKRKHPRVPLRVNVVVVHGKQSFRSYSKNVSRGGLLLEKKIPWSLPGQSCKVFLTNEETNERIEFTAKVISDSSNPFRIGFEDSENRFNSILQVWIEQAMKQAA